MLSKLNIRVLGRQGWTYYQASLFDVHTIHLEKDNLALVFKQINQKRRYSMPVLFAQTTLNCLHFLNLFRSLPAMAGCLVSPDHFLLRS